MDLSSLLMSLAEMSHVASLVSVLTGLVLVALLTLRLMGQDWADFHNQGGAVTRAPPHRPAMVDLRPTPFRCWVKAVVASTDSDTVKVTLGRQGEGAITVRCFWGVSVESFHHILASPWPWFQHAFLTPASNVFGAEGCLRPGQTHTSQRVQDSDKETDIYLELERPPEMQTPSNYLGPAPRKAYPLVLVAMPCPSVPEIDSSGSNSSGGDPELEEGDVDAALMVAVHLQDAVCRISTHALATFVKSRTGQCTRLVPMYSQTDSECVVCQELKVSRCILPCRHACVCHQCFAHLNNRCPMCRTWITSYFPVGTSADDDDDDLAASTADRTADSQSDVAGDAARRQNNSTNLVRRIARAVVAGIGVRQNE